MSEYHIIRNILTFAPFVIIQALLLLLKRRACYIRYPVVLFVGWIVFTVFVNMFWTYSIERAPTKELQLRMAEEEGVRCAAAVFVGWMYVSIFIAISETVRFGCRRFLFKEKHPCADDLADLECFLRWCSRVSQLLAANWHDLMFIGGATFLYAAILLGNLVVWGFSSDQLVPTSVGPLMPLTTVLLVMSAIGMVSGPALCLRGRRAIVPALVFSTSFLLLGLYLYGVRLWLFAQYAVAVGAKGYEPVLACLISAAQEQTVFTVTAALITISLFIKGRKHH